MSSTKYRPVLTLLMVTCLLLGVASPLHARPIKFPKEEPTFTLELPEDWTSKADKDGNLDCDPEDDSGYYFGILLLTEVHTKAELKALLPKLAKKMAEGGKIKGLELGDIEVSKNENDISFIGLRGDGKVEGKNFVIVLHGFEPEKGKFYAIMTAASEKVDKAHEKDYEAIYDSIKSLE